MHCYERPTVELALDVPGGSRDETRPDFWDWVPCQRLAPVQEYAYGPEEICRLLKIYGDVCGKEIRPDRYPRFRIRVRGLFTGRMLATGHWVWNPRCRTYDQHGDFWLTIPPMHEWPDEALRAIAARSGQRVEPCKGCVQS